MPKKGDRNRKRRTRQGNSTVSTSGTMPAPSRRTPVPKRTTKNSSGNRGGSAPPTKKAVAREATPAAKKIGKRCCKGGKRDSSQQEPVVFTSETGETYKAGDHAFVDSQQSDLPFHICVIKKFTVTRKDTVIAEVKWFYRVSELPESVYSLLMDDRKEGPRSEQFANPKISGRELFVAFNEDTHPASLFRGKCSVKNISDIPDLTAYVANEDHFFHCYGYKPESRRLTDLEENSLVPASQQAILPDLIVREDSDHSLRDTLSEEEAATSLSNHEELSWKPQLKDEDLLMYLRAARSIALHAGVFMNGYLSEGCLAASSDETTQLAFDTLHKKSYDIKEAIQELVRSPVIKGIIGKKSWSKESAHLFAKGMRQFGKNFYRIKKELLPKTEICDLIAYYYVWKKTNVGLSSRATRRQRKQTHIRMGRAHQKPLPQDSPPKREFMDWASEDEVEMTDEGGDKLHQQGYYVCHHCFVTVSPDWHHVGINRRILCHDCRLYFQKYGCLRPLTVKREPPEFVYRDYHDNQVDYHDNQVDYHDNQTDYHDNQAATDDQSVAGSITPSTSAARRTRNSNRPHHMASSSSRPGLRSGKNYSKSDSEEDASYSSEESSYSMDIPVAKPKLQARHSLLEKLGGEAMNTDPTLKRGKRKQQANDSDAEDSETSGGDGDQESKSVKSGSGETGESPGVSSTHSSNLNEEEHSPTSGKDSSDTATAPPTNAPPIPPQFAPVCKDKEVVCSRTDLVYVRPPAEERRGKVMVPATPPGTSQVPEATPPSSKVLITPHAPQLPAGPSGPLLGFYGYDPAHFVRQQEGDSSLHQHHHWLALQQQQQHKQPTPLLLPHTDQLATLTPLLPHPALMQYVTATNAVDHAHPQHFSFPAPEEMGGRVQRVPWPQEHVVHNSLIPVAMERQGRPEDPMSHVIHPVTNMEALLQQQQMAAFGLYGISPELIELQHQYEQVTQWLQKDPSVIQHQAVQQVLMRYQQMQQQLAMVQVATLQQEHQNRMLQEMMGQQQRDMGKPHLQSHPHEDLHTPRIRPGVIVQPK